MFEKEVVIDGKGHILGRLAATVAKELLYGQKVVIVRAEEVLRTGDFHSNRLIYMQFLRKRKNTNPKKGPFHFRSPSKILWRVIRGMLPHKIARGAQALENLKIFEGVPSPYDKKKRVVIPNALKVVTCKGDTPVTNLGELAASIGWRHCELIQELEEKRKVKSAAYWQKKKEKLERLKKAQESLEKTTLKPILTTLSQYGFA